MCALIMVGPDWWLKDAIDRVSQYICYALCGLVPFKQSKKREKHIWRSVTFSRGSTPSWVLFMFLKLYKWYQILQRITYCF